MEDIELCGALLEVKCPFTQRDCAIEEAVLSGSFYIKTYELDKESSYWHQVQGQLHLCQKAVCNFVEWRTKETLILEIKKDPAWDDNLHCLQDFYTRRTCISRAFITDLLKHHS